MIYEAFKEGIDVDKELRPMQFTPSPFISIEVATLKTLFSCDEILVVEPYYGYMSEYQWGIKVITIHDFFGTDLNLNAIMEPYELKEKIKLIYLPEGMYWKNDISVLIHTILHDKWGKLAFYRDSVIWRSQ